MTHVLIVDDSPIDQTLVGQILEMDRKISVTAVDDGQAALAAVEKCSPDLVLTDLIMPELNGLELVRELRTRHPGLPVILMTSQGSEEIAVEALRAGASSYVPKAALGPDLLPTIREIVELAHSKQREEALFDSMRNAECVFELKSDVRLVRPLVKHLQRQLLQLGWPDDAEHTQVGVALVEAVHNGIEHGNLELHSEARRAGIDEYAQLVDRRARQAPYRDRRLRVRAEVSRTRAQFDIRDEGSGFDPMNLPDPRDPANLWRLSGRGVMLMRTFMDEVRYNERGNEVRLVKLRE